MIEERPLHPQDHTACGTPNPPFWCEEQAMSVPIDNYIIALIIAVIYLRRNKIKT